MIDVPSQRLYAGGQECPGCGRARPVSHHYCSSCGTPLCPELPEPLGDGEVFIGDEVFVVVKTSTERFVMPAAHSNRDSWEVTGRVYGDTRIRLYDRRDELRLEWDERRDHWLVRASTRRVHLYPDVQDDCSPVVWPDVDLQLQDVQAAIEQERDGDE